MLKAIYELDSTLTPEKIADFREERGEVRFFIHPLASLEDVIRRMNEIADHLCHTTGWLQLWDGGVSVLSITFELDATLEPGIGVEARETDGQLRLGVDPRLSVSEFVAAMNPTSATVLEGGQLFQCWEGEIVSNASPERGAAARSAT